MAQMSLVHHRAAIELTPLSQRMERVNSSLRVQKQHLGSITSPRSCEAARAYADSHAGRYLHSEPSNQIAVWRNHSAHPANLCHLCGVRHVAVLTPRRGQYRSTGLSPPNCKGALAKSHSEAHYIQSSLYVAIWHGDNDRHHHRHHSRASQQHAHFIRHQLATPERVARVAARNKQ